MDKNLKKLKDKKMRDKAEKDTSEVGKLTTNTPP